MKAISVFDIGLPYANDVGLCESAAAAAAAAAAAISHSRPCRSVVQRECNGALVFFGSAVSLP